MDERETQESFDDLFEVLCDVIERAFRGLPLRPVDDETAPKLSSEKSRLATKRVMDVVGMERHGMGWEMQ